MIVSAKENFVYKSLPQGSTEEEVFSGRIHYRDSHGSNMSVSVMPLVNKIKELKQQNEFLTNAKDEMVQRACADYELAIAELKQQLAQHEWVSVCNNCGSHDIIHSNTKE